MAAPRTAGDTMPERQASALDLLITFLPSEFAPRIVLEAALLEKAATLLQAPQLVTSKSRPPTPGQAAVDDLYFTGLIATPPATNSKL
jgi:hypothetical protein